MAPIGPGPLPLMRSRRGTGRMRRSQAEKAIAARDRATVRRGGEPAARAGKPCVRACAGTAPARAGALTRRVGERNPPTEVVKFPVGDPLDRPARGGPMVAGTIDGDQRSIPCLSLAWGWETHK